MGVCLFILLHNSTLPSLPTVHFGAKAHFEANSHAGHLDRSSSNNTQVILGTISNIEIDCKEDNFHVHMLDVFCIQKKSCKRVAHYMSLFGQDEIKI